MTRYCNEALLGRRDQTLSGLSAVYSLTRNHSLIDELHEREVIGRDFW